MADSAQQKLIVFAQGGADVQDAVTRLALPGAQWLNERQRTRFRGSAWGKTEEKWRWKGTAVVQCLGGKGGGDGGVT